MMKAATTVAAMPNKAKAIWMVPSRITPKPSNSNRMMRAPTTIAAMRSKRKGDLDGAIADYTKAIELKPDDAGAYNNRGNAKQTKGDLDGAIADYTKAIELKPDDAGAYCNRAAWRKAKGDLGGALADYNKAIELQRIGKPLEQVA